MHLLSAILGWCSRVGCLSDSGNPVQTTRITADLLAGRSGFNSGFDNRRQITDFQYFMHRRKLLLRLVQGLAGIGAVLACVPLLQNWSSGWSAKPFLDIDLRDLPEGRAKRVQFAGRTLLILRLDQEMLRGLEQLPDDALLDPHSSRSSGVGPAAAPLPSGRKDLLVVYANCTHLGCELQVRTNPATGVALACPCHQSEFDFAGRVLKGQVAVRNLERPGYRLLARNLLRIEG